MVVECNALGARPKAKLDFISNGKSMSNAKVLIQERKNVTDFSGSLIFIPEHDTTIECVSFLENCNITKVVNVTIFVSDSGKKNVPSNVLTGISPSKLFNDITCIFFNLTLFYFASYSNFSSVIFLTCDNYL